jgi:radical SAM superfamily enzyme YgiQ (UPF0313 family)
MVGEYLLMKICLLHLPDWNVFSYRRSESDKTPKIDGDFSTIPYGLLMLAAQAKRKGHEVFIYNLSCYPWDELRKIICYIKADIFGFTCLTINHFCVGLISAYIRELYPNVHIVVGGPHASSLPEEMLKNYPAIDTIVIGEGEQTFMEIIQNLEMGKPVKNIHGTAWRCENEIKIAATRSRIKDLDSLASPADYFSTGIILTSRGCPGQCTFCQSKAIWGRRVEYHSAEYTLDLIEKNVCVHKRKTISIKDDTFTTDRKRVLAICKGILDRKLNFLWSCDTRVDRLNDELLYAMRLAGCQQISLGVESASPKILKSINKNIKIEQVFETTRLAQKYGFQIRYFLIAGNRFESPDTIRQSLDFIEKARPNSYTLTPLVFFPGTEDFKLLQKSKNISSDIFFSEQYKNKYIYMFHMDLSDDMKKVYDWYINFQSQNNYYNYSSKECLNVTKIFPDLGAAHMDLASAYIRENNPDIARHHLFKARELNYPLNCLIYNNYACIAALKNNYSDMLENIEKAIKMKPVHPIVIQNYNAVQKCEKGASPLNDISLVSTNDFKLIGGGAQPESSGPIKL